MGNPVCPRTYILTHMHTRPIISMGGGHLNIKKVGGELADSTIEM